MPHFFAWVVVKAKDPQYFKWQIWVFSLAGCTTWTKLFSARLLVKSLTITAILHYMLCQNGTITAELFCKWCPIKSTQRKVASPG